MSKHHLGQIVSAVHWDQHSGTCLGNGTITNVGAPREDGHYWITVDLGKQTERYLMSPTGRSDYVGPPLPAESRPTGEHLTTLTRESDPAMIRRRVATLEAIYEEALTCGRVNPQGPWRRRALSMVATVNAQSRVDWHAADVLALANKSPGELLDDHNAGRGGALALLVEIADEEGWS